MRRFLHKRWFLTSLALLIALGLTLGMTIPADGLEALLGRLGPVARQGLSTYPRLSTALVLFLMAFSLETRQLTASFRSPGPVLWASLVNFGMIPLVAWGMMGWQQTADFTIGLMIAATTPSTIAAGSVWTRKAKGNDAVSLMVTILTNGTCFAVTPFWLKLTTGSNVQLDSGYLVTRLLIAVLIPMLLGQVLRQFARPSQFATRHKTPIGVAAQILILSIVFYAACKAGTRLAENGSTPGLGAVTLVWGTCIVLHLGAMFVSIQGGRLWGFSRPDLAAIAFSGSQKTLPIGILLATDPTMFGDPNLLGPSRGIPFAVFPILMYHASQLFIDTVVADRLAAQSRQETQPEESDTI